MYSKVLDKVFDLLYWYVRPLLKWFLRRFTALCELQRICYGTSVGARRTKAVEKSLEMSRTEQLRNLVRSLDERMADRALTNDQFLGDVMERAPLTVMQIKNIKPAVHPDFERLFGTCSEQIWGYKRLFCLVESLRTTPFDSDNPDHERKLLKLWDILMPHTKLQNRITKQWQDIGFQGDDPKTDFRGMGILGLENLLFFAEEYTPLAQHALSHSMHPQHGYTLAIVGINLTSMAYNLLKSGHVKGHFYNAIPSYPSLNAFHHMYCYLFYEFDKFWMKSKPKSIMDFSFIQEKFELKLKSMLVDDDCVLKIMLPVDNL